MAQVARSDQENAIVWRPSAGDLARSRLQRLIERTGSGDYQGLLARVAADPAWYWQTVLRDLDLVWHRPWDEIWDLSRGKMWPRWFPGAGFNYVTSALDRHADGPTAQRAAIVWEGDGGEVRTLTFAELGELTDRLANALRALGVRKGDRVGIFMPMEPETVAATLACSKLGAIYIPLFSGYGEDAVASRLNDSEATFLITADGFPRRGKLVPMKHTADAALAQAPAVTTCLVLKRAGNDVDWTEGRDVWWHAALEEAPVKRITEPTAADDPYMIIYTSGTTGRPKGAVHIHAGFPIKAIHDLAYCFDVREDDVVFWLSDLGWMMGPWLIAGGLTLGATIVLLEGTPDYPGPDRFWQMTERHRITVLGIAPTAIRALIPHGEEIVRKHDLSSLRALGSTGETWNPDPWFWYFREVGKERCPIINYSGGTETGGGIVSGLTIAPLKPCSFAGPVPGMVADVVNEDGEPVRGEVGELIVREPWVGMTHGFWHDPERYEETYWSHFPNIWLHGDWAEIDDDGFWYIRGRSDDTIKVAGKRVGPAEVESACVACGTVQEAAAVGVPHAMKGTAVVVFAVPKPGTQTDDDSAAKIAHEIGERLGHALRPERVHFVRALPKTRNAKIMRRVIRAAYLGKDAGDLTALENPEAVREIALLHGTLPQ